MALMRTNIGMAMVCMLNSTALALVQEDSTEFLGQRSSLSHQNSSPIDDFTSGCVLSREAREDYEVNFCFQLHCLLSLCSNTNFFNKPNISNDISVLCKPPHSAGDSGMEFQ